jgi:hypothetical protein
MPTQLSAIGLARAMLNLVEWLVSTTVRSFNALLPLVRSSCPVNTTISSVEHVVADGYTGPDRSGLPDGPKPVMGLARYDT